MSERSSDTTAGLTVEETAADLTYTVVYRVDGGRAAHDEWWRKVSNTFAGHEHISIVASGSFDALKRLHELEGPVW